MNLGGLPEPFDADGSSFFAVLRRNAPEAVPHTLTGQAPPFDLTEGTTIVALTFADGVVIAGDRRATAGNLISKRDIRKVFPSDDHSAVGISGVAGPAMELAKVFATELEHYEKVEGERLSLEGKANKLAAMVRSNLPMAMQGLVVVPLFAGFDVPTSEGRIFDYDPVGGRYLALDFAAAGSGSLTARGVLKRDHDAAGSVNDAMKVAIHALFEAADEDTATGGPDLMRQIFPIVAVIDADGYRELPDDAIEPIVRSVIEE